MARTPLSPGRVGSNTTRFLPVHRQENETPVALELSLTVPMSLEDVTAALWYLVGAWPLDELDDALNDAAWLHRMVLEVVLAMGAEALESERLSLAQIKPGTAGAGALSRLRARVAELYGPPRPRRGKPADRRELAGVAR
jgi:hypothetical protein